MIINKIKTITLALCIIAAMPVPGNAAVAAFRLGTRGNRRWISRGIH